MRTTDTEQRKKLPVPWEYTLWIRCQKTNHLPFSGGVLDQPHILMLCLDLVDAELDAYRAFKRQIDERNKELAAK